jgi:DNA replication protein DnaC
MLEAMPKPLTDAGVPPRYLPARIDACPDLPPQLVEHAHQFAEKPDGFFLLHGPPGAGKTWLAVAMLRAVIGTGVYHPVSRLFGGRPLECGFIAEGDLLAGRRASFDGQRRDETKWTASVGLLVLDDFASSRLTDWSAGELAGLVGRRYDNVLPTILTSNLDLNAIAAAVDPRTSSRLREDGNVLALGGRDLRVTGSLGRACRSGP